MAETAVRFEGHENRECGDHHSTGHRAWCFTCSEWCYEDIPCKGCELPSLRADVQLLREAATADGALHKSAEGEVSAVHALVARWQQDVTNLYAANEEEGHAPAAMLRAARAAEIERCIHELREALAAPSPVSAATGETGEARE